MMRRFTLSLSKGALVLVLGSSCAAGRIQQTRETFSKKWVCPIDRVQAEEGEKIWYASGCDLRAECRKPKGPCELVWTPGERTERARADAMRQTGCPAEQLAFEFRREGVWAEGCGKQLVCEDPMQPCKFAVKPGCQDDARWEYDQCVERAADRGRHNKGSAWFSSNPIKGTIQASVDQGRAEERCASTRDAQLRACLEKFRPSQQIP
jgi:hypothetical protein